MEERQHFSDGCGGKKVFYQEPALVLLYVALVLSFTLKVQLPRRTHISPPEGKLLPNTNTK